MSYTVKNGDSMWGIWKRTAASDGVSWADFKRANASVFAANDGDVIRPGDQVNIPKAPRAEDDRMVRGEPAPWSRPSVEPAPASTTAVAKERQYYNPATRTVVKSPGLPGVMGDVVSLRALLRSDRDDKEIAAIRQLSTKSTKEVRDIALLYRMTYGETMPSTLGDANRGGVDFVLRSVGAR